MGWKEPVVNRDKEPVDSAIEKPTNVRQIIIDKIERLAQSKRVRADVIDGNKMP